MNPILLTPSDAADDELLLRLLIVIFILPPALLAILVTGLAGEAISTLLRYANRARK